MIPDVAPLVASHRGEPGPEVTAPVRDDDVWDTSTEIDVATARLDDNPSSLLRHFTPGSLCGAPGTMT